MTFMLPEMGRSAELRKALVTLSPTGSVSFIFLMPSRYSFSSKPSARWETIATSS